MKSIKSVGLFLTLTLVVGLPLYAGEKAIDVKHQKCCPVRGGEIDTSVYVDHDGRRVYFCCGGCIDKFKANPEKYVKKLEDQGVTLEKAPKPQTMCPVMEGKINREFHTDYEGKRIYFCCEPCIGKFNDNPKRYMKKMKKLGITLEEAPAPEGG